MSKRKPWEPVEITGTAQVILHPNALLREIDALVHSGAPPHMMTDAIARHTQILWFKGALDEHYLDLDPMFLEEMKRRGYRQISEEIAKRIDVKIEVNR